MARLLQEIWRLRKLPKKGRSYQGSGGSVVIIWELSYPVDPKYLHGGILTVVIPIETLYTLYYVLTKSLSLLRYQRRTELARGENW